MLPGPCLGPKRLMSGCKWNGLNTGAHSRCHVCKHMPAANHLSTAAYPKQGCIHAPRCRPKQWSTPPSTATTFNASHSSVLLASRRGTRLKQARAAQVDQLSEPPAAALSYVQQLQLEHGIENFIEFDEGENGLPRVVIQHPVGDRLEIYLHGACITQWTKPEGDRHLFLHQDETFDASSPIRTGMPLVFPQWREGVMVENGFADKMHWEVVETGLDSQFFNSDPSIDEQKLQEMEESIGQRLSAADLQALSESMDQSNTEEDVDSKDNPETSENISEASDDNPEVAYGDPAPYVVFRLQDTEFTRSMWPHKFELLYKVTLSEDDSFPDVNPPTDAEPVKAVDGDLRINIAESMLKPHKPADEDVNEQEEEEEEEEVDDIPAMQITQEFIVKNFDDEDEKGESFMEFQLGALPHFLVKDLLRSGRFVRTLGLGGKNVFDYSSDPRNPIMGGYPNDYLNFGDGKLDTLFINTNNSDVLFCPGNRTHYQIFQRHGFKDIVAQHVGLHRGHGLDWTRFYACLGSGRFAIPKRIPPQSAWYGEQVIRFYRRYWDLPVWDRDSLQPMPGLEQRFGESEAAADDDEEDDAAFDAKDAGDDREPV